MPVQRSLVTTIGVVFVTLLLSWNSSLLSPTAIVVPPVIGQNNTALFLVTSDYGLSNVHVATAQALLERHAHVQLHFGSFAPMASRLKRLSSHIKGTDGKEIVFHPVNGLSVYDTCRTFGKNTSNSIHPPGWAGINHLCKDIQLFISPWSAEDHLAIYEQIATIIDDVNPAIVVLDTLFRPAIDATRDKNRLHAIISPNTLIENFPTQQPGGQFLWKYPAMGSGLQYPVPWSKIPENVVLNLQLISAMLRMPEIHEKKAYLKSKGFKDPINFLALHRPDVPWLSQTMPEASIPVEVIPQNVTCTGPITLSLSTASEQDEELASWLTKAPTILVNLGSGFEFSEERAITMAGAIARVLQGSNVQVSWKLKKESSYDDRFLEPLLPFTNAGRVRVERWLAVDPPSLLDSGHIIASVHHGGSGCYHEAISAGIPQVILPLWLDLYGFAQLVEYIGVGVWGCRENSPTWTLILAVRDEEAGEAARDKLASRHQQSTSEIEVWKLDMSDYDSIIAFAKRADALAGLDVVILNAGVCKAIEVFNASTGYEEDIQSFSLPTISHACSGGPPLLVLGLLSKRPSGKALSPTALYWRLQDKAASLLLISRSSTDDYWLASHRMARLVYTEEGEALSQSLWDEVVFEFSFADAGDIMSHISA
ncbi:hypothetical protein F5Y19DRAFT_484015 [Xylariaceae sp. FL1651]|nr:hypothetical protein F5Y19DRAFT_484015 [Xylariaceae sp. FL1651]